MCQVDEKMMLIQKRILALIIFVAFLFLVPKVSSGDQGNFTFTINQNGVIDVQGEFVKEIGKAPGEGKATVNVLGEPIEIGSKRGFNFTLSANGNFSINNTSIDLDYLELNIKVSGDNTNSTGEITFNIKVPSNQTIINATGKVEINQMMKNSTGYIFLTGNINIDYPFNPEDISQIRKQLQFIGPDMLNFALVQSGITYMRYTDFDLSGITIDENGVRGTFRMAIEVNMTEYMIWYKGQLYQSGISEEKINKQAEKLEQALKALSEEPFHIMLDASVKLKNNELSFRAELNISTSNEYIRAYSELMKTALSTISTPPTIPGGQLGQNTMRPIEITMEEMTTPLNYTIAEKPINITCIIYTENNTLWMDIKIYNLSINATNETNYYGALKTLKTFASDMMKNMSINYLKIEITGTQAPPELNATEIPSEKILNVKPNSIELRNATIDDINMITLKTFEETTIPIPTTTTTQKLTIITTTRETQTTPTGTTATTVTTMTENTEANTTTPAQSSQETSSNNIVLVTALAIVAVIAAVAFKLKK